MLGVPSHLPGLIPAGFSTVPLQSVAGFHWASPSTSLDKSILTYRVDAFSIVSCFGLGVTIFPAPEQEIYCPGLESVLSAATVSC